jgi:hypothetical protein
LTQKNCEIRREGEETNKVREEGRNEMIEARKE